MPTFQRKPTIIEAEQYTGVEPFPKGACTIPMAQDTRSAPHVHTAHKGQIVWLEVGDWVTAEPDGNGYYPIKDDIMKATYYEVNDWAVRQDSDVLGDHECGLCGASGCDVELEQDDEDPSYWWCKDDLACDKRQEELWNKIERDTLSRLFERHPQLVQ